MMLQAAIEEDIKSLVEELNFKQKVERSLSLIEQAYQEYGDALVVANSLGKDSVAVWHLVKQVSLPMAVNAVFEQDWLKDDPMLHAVTAMQQQDPEHSWSSQPFPEAGTLYQLLSETVLACMKGEKTNIKAALDEVAGEWQKTIDEAMKAG